MNAKVNSFCQLSKVKISFFSCLTCSVGYILATGRLSLAIFFPTLGIFFLACGSASLNHIQEKGLDARMPRTKKRPIPSGDLSLIQAVTFSLSFLSIGFAILFWLTNSTALILGLLALIWYNGVYTYLKRITAFAVVPGSLIGAIPPAVGWAAGGGPIFDPQILAVSFFFFIWQIPHFWLLLVLYGDQYEKAGLPSMTSVFSVEQIKRLIFVWTAATTISSLLIPLFGAINISLINFGLFLATLWLIYKSSKMFWGSDQEFSFGYAFREINIYALLVIVLISIDSLV